MLNCFEWLCVKSPNSNVLDTRRHQAKRYLWEDVMTKVQSKIVSLAWVLFFMVPAICGAGELEGALMKEPTSSWSIDTRVGVVADGSSKQIQCSDCRNDGYDVAGVVALDFAYHWSDFQAGVSGSFSEVVLGNSHYRVSTTFGWTRRFNSWLQASVVSEAGVHVIPDIASGFMNGVVGDIDSAVLPYLGARFGLDVKVWDAAGLVLGLWGGAELDLMTQEINADMSVMFSDIPKREVHLAGGHQLGAGVTLGFEF